MGAILIADDTPIWRDAAAAALQGKGHRVFAVADGLSVLGVLQKERIDVVILDAAMPRLDDFASLEHIRSFSKWNKLPVIIMTARTRAEQGNHGRRLGAAEYLIKSELSPSELVERVGRHLDAGVSKPVFSASLETGADAVASAATPRLLSRQQSLDRAREAMQARTLPGVVAEVIDAAMSPRVDLVGLVRMIGHDPALAAHVLHAANSVENTAGRGRITTLADAVRVIGCTMVRQIAASMGVLEAMPPPEPDGFNPVRCWQHSIAVARLCDHLAPEGVKGSAYLVGLCHDLGEVLFRTHFGPEFRQVLQAERESGLTRIEAERRMLGVTHTELVQVILKQLALPEPMARAIGEFHSPTAAAAHGDNPMVRVLKLADSYSAGLLLGSSDQGSLRPLSRNACRAATGAADPAPIDGRAFRSEVCKLLVQYARISPKEAAPLIAPPSGGNSPRIWLARDSAYSTFDPIAASLEAQARVIDSEALPTPQEFSKCQGLVIVSLNTSAAPFTPCSVSRLLANTPGLDRPTLWLTAKSDAGTIPPIPGLSIADGPTPLRRIADFLSAL